MKKIFAFVVACAWLTSASAQTITTTGSVPTATFKTTKCRVTIDGNDLHSNGCDFSLPLKNTVIQQRDGKTVLMFDQEVVTSWSATSSVTCLNGVCR